MQEKSKKNCTRGKEDYIQDYLNKGERLNLNLLKQKAGKFLSTGVS